MRTRIHFEERCGWAWWAHLAISVTFVAALLPLLELAQGKVWGEGDAMDVRVAILCLSLGLGLPGAIYFFVGQLRVRVTDAGVEAAWGFSERIRKVFPFREIRGLESVTYSPLSEFGGWGIRVGVGKKRAWTVQGNRAVRLHLQDGTLFYLGSRRPEQLLGWIRSVGREKLSTGLAETEPGGGGSKEAENA